MSGNERRNLILASMVLGGSAFVCHSTNELRKLGIIDKDNQEEPRPKENDPFLTAPLPIRHERYKPVEINPDPLVDRDTHTDVVGNKIIGNEFEPHGLEFREWGESVPVYDVRNATSMPSLLSELQKIYSKLESSGDGDVDRIEYFVTPEIVESFNKDGKNFAGFVNSHLGMINKLLRINNLPKRVGLARMFIANPGVVENILDGNNPPRVDPGGFNFVMGLDSEARLPEGCHFRFVTNKNPIESFLFKNGRDVHFLHELGHMSLLLGYDLYMTQEPGGQVVESYTKNSLLIQASVPKVELPADWLMVSQSLGGDIMRTPILEPFSVRAIKKMKDKGIKSWVEANRYWNVEVPKEEISPTWVKMYHPEGHPLTGPGEVYVFEGTYVQDSDNTYRRTYGPHPSMIYDLEKNSDRGAFVFDPRGLPKVHGSEIPLQGVPRTWFFMTYTEEGLHGSYLSHLDFLNASWASENPNVSSLRVPATGFLLRDFHAQPLQSVKNKPLAPFSSVTTYGTQNSIFKT